MSSDLSLLGNQVATEKKVPEAFVQPSIPWPNYPVNVTFKNLSENIIQYSYPEDGQLNTGTLGPNQILPNPIVFKVHTPYMFSLKCGRQIRSAR